MTVGNVVDFRAGVAEIVAGTAVIMVVAAVVVVAMTLHVSVAVADEIIAGVAIFLAVTM